MVGGLYSAAAGMAAQQAWLDALSNDVANADTDGYKQTRVGFRDLLYQPEDGVDVGAGAAVVDAGRSFRQGPLAASADPLSLAIDGSGFFQVRRPDGQLALTRDGSFRVDAQGSLVTAAGDRLVPPIAVPPGTRESDVTVAADGTVSAAGRTLGRIQLVDVPSQSGLLPAGDNLFLPTARSGAPAAAPRAQVKQGFLEGSNVDLADAMTGLVQAQRDYELASRAVRTQDQLMEIANGIRR